METTRTATLLRIAREALAKRANRADEEGADSGFTLIELMVVLLILAILLAIAIPTFLGVTVSAHDRAAQSNLTNGMTAGKASFVAGQSYAANNAGEATVLNSAEPSLTFAAGVSLNQNTLSEAVYKQTGASTNNPDVLVLAAWSNQTQHCWWAADVENTAPPTITGATANPPAGTTYGETHATANTGCNATDPTKFPGTWANTYTPSPA
jgi:type IV pilus assembly protein PilA